MAPLKWRLTLLDLTPHDLPNILMLPPIPKGYRTLHLEIANMDTCQKDQVSTVRVFPLLVATQAPQDHLNCPRSNASAHYSILFRLLRSELMIFRLLRSEAMRLTHCQRAAQVQVNWRYWRGQRLSLLALPLWARVRQLLCLQEPIPRTNHDQSSVIRTPFNMLIPPWLWGDLSCPTQKELYNVVVPYEFGLPCGILSHGRPFPIPFHDTILVPATSNDLFLFHVYVRISTCISDALLFWALHISLLCCVTTPLCHVTISLRILYFFFLSLLCWWYQSIVCITSSLAVSQTRKFHRFGYYLIRIRRTGRKLRRDFINKFRQGTEC